MFGTLLRTVIVVVLVAAAVAFVVGYRAAAPPDRPADERPIVGMTGRMNERPASERADGTLDRAAEASRRIAGEARAIASDAALSTKISSKMALDDAVEARRISVRTTDGVVTLEGTVGSDEERQRAVRLARETDGVRSVVDRLQVLEDVRADDPSGRR